MDRAHPEHHESLWTLAWTPTVWAAHFLLCYVLAALVCQDAARGLTFDGLRLAIGGFSVLAWLLIGVHAVRCARDVRGVPDGDGGVAAEPARTRRRFFAAAGLLLAALSAVAVLYSALPALFFGDCR
jgi:hypothetical protein